MTKPTGIHPGNKDSRNAQNRLNTAKEKHHKFFELKDRNPSDDPYEISINLQKKKYKAAVEANKLRNKFHVV